MFWSLIFIYIIEQGWEKIILAAGGQLQKGLNSFVVLGGLDHLESLQ
jgi:hypothetical protein